MRFKKIALALFACLALGAFAANFAQAAEGEGWTIEGSGAIPSGTHQSVSCSKHGTSTLIFTSTLLGEPVELSAEGIDCVEATIDNTTSKGHSAGKLRFTGVKVLKPSTACTVGNVKESGSGVVTTEALTDQVIMDPTSGSTAVLDKFSPEVSGGAFVTIEFGGATCPLKEDSAPVKGTACGEAVHTAENAKHEIVYSPNVTGELSVIQTALFGATQQTTGGCALTLGTKAAGLAGAVDNTLAVTNVGKKWGAD
jgi:hypothetical protein